MKKTFGVYGLIWALCLAVFNLIVFIIPGLVNSDGFWVGYIFITITFIIQLASAYVTFKESNLQKTFYNIPLISVSYTSLIAMLAVGGICMGVEAIPNWLAVILCVLVLVANIIAIIKAGAAASIVSSIDEKVKEKTLLFKSLAIDAESLISEAGSDELREKAKSVFEAIKYSDPMSSPQLSESEKEIEGLFTAFSSAVKSGNSLLADESAKALLVSVEKRNMKCKLLK